MVRYTLADNRQGQTFLGVLFDGKGDGHSGRDQIDSGYWAQRDGALYGFVALFHLNEAGQCLLQGVKGGRCGLGLLE